MRPKHTHSVTHSIIRLDKVFFVLNLSIPLSREFSTSAARSTEICAVCEIHKLSKIQSLTKHYKKIEKIITNTGVVGYISYIQLTLAQETKVNVYSDYYLNFGCIDYLFGLAYHCKKVFKYSPAV